MGEPIPVAPVVVKVIVGFNADPRQTIGVVEGGDTVTLPTFMVIFAVPGQPDSPVTVSV